MRLAAVDVGSNTVHALVADVHDGKLETVAHYVEMPSLGEVVARTGKIGPAKTREAIEALASVVERARSHGFEHLVAGATEAIREAADSAAFRGAAEKAIGVPVRLISPRREAELSFLGVSDRHATRRQWLMADLGGGSTELVVARGRRMESWRSLRIGTGVLAAKHLSDPPSPAERLALRADALALLRGAPECDPGRFVATGGTASNLPLLLSRHHPPEILTTRTLLHCEQRLDSAPALLLALELDLPVARVTALRGGVEVLLLLLDWAGLDQLHVSHEGVRQGMLLAYLEKAEDWYLD